MNVKQATLNLLKWKRPKNRSGERRNEIHSPLRRFPSPGRLLIIVVAWIVVAESFDMILISQLPPLPLPTIAVLHAVSVLIILSLFYRFLYRPFRAQWEKHQLMETALLESNERYRSLVEDIDFGIALIDKDHNFLMSNKAHAGFYQKKPSNLVGKKCFRECARLDNPCAECPGRVAMRTRKPTFTDKIQTRADGSQWFAHIHAFPVFGPEGSSIGFIEVTEDISERKLVEEKLVESGERLKLALDASRDGLWDFNVQTGEVYYSPRWETMLGHQPGEMEQMYRSWEDLLHPDDKDRVLGNLNDHLEGRSQSYEAEVRMRSKSGKWVWILSRGRVVDRDPNGRPLRMVGIHTEITDRKQAEEEIHHLSRQLLNVTEEERARLANDLHDEFGQVLAALQFGTESLKNSLPEKMEKSRSHCQKQIELIALLGDHVHSLSTNLRPSILDNMGIKAALDWHVQQFSRQITGINIDFQVSGFEGWLSKKTNIVLYRICQESLNNIVKHAKSKQVRICLTCSSKLVRLTIQDDGVGFEPKQVGARGIGLLGMRERAASLGGSLSITSRKGEGTEIKVELPLSWEGKNELYQSPYR